MNPLDELQQWSNEIHAARKAQANTVKRLNDLTPEHNGRVHAGEVDAEAAELCHDDTGHGSGTVVFTICGELHELCPDCAERVLDGLLREGHVVTDELAPIDIEVYR